MLYSVDADGQPPFWLSFMGDEQNMTKASLNVELASPSKRQGVGQVSANVARHLS